MNTIYGTMKTSQYIEVEYPCKQWYMMLIGYYILLPLVVITVGLLVLDEFSLWKLLFLSVVLQLLWLRRIIKDIWVPYAVLIEEERIEVSLRLGQRIKHYSIAIRDLESEYDTRKASKTSLSLWQREENRYPSQIFFFLKDCNWTEEKVQDVIRSLDSISHYSVHRKP